MTYPISLIIIRVLLLLSCVSPIILSSAIVGIGGLYTAELTAVQILVLVFPHDKPKID